MGEGPTHKILTPDPLDAFGVSPSPLGPPLQTPKYAGVVAYSLDTIQYVNIYSLVLLAGAEECSCSNFEQRSLWLYQSRNASDAIEDRTVSKLNDLARLQMVLILLPLFSGDMCCRLLD